MSKLTMTPQPALAANAASDEDPDAHTRVRLFQWWIPVLVTILTAAVNVSVVLPLSRVLWPEFYGLEALTMSLVAAGVAVVTTLPTNLVIYTYVMRQVRRRDEMERRAATDYLTGIANRRGFERGVSTLLGEKSCAFLIVDLDHFKWVNDTHGHEAGDRVLARVGHELRATIRVSDVVGRLGGEEFGIFMPGLDCEQALTVATRLRQQISGIRVRVSDRDSQSISVTVSGGLACGNALSYGELYRRADRALYKAKQSGRNRIEIAHPQPEPA